MARQQVRAGDLTGRKKAELAEKHAAEQEAQAAQVAMATAAAAPNLQDTIDLEPKKDEPQPESIGDIEVANVDVKEPLVEFRVNETLEQVTIGVGNNYDFVEGQKYRAPKRIYDHLEEKGLIWH